MKPLRLKYDSQMADGSGLRYDTDKLRYDLVDPFAHRELVRVFTMGAKKYAPNNWKKGMKWSRVIGSLKRHLAALESGEDHDPESQMLHAAHIQWNAHCLTAYYKIYPEGDDRQHSWLQTKKIGLDIDDVLADWMGAWTTKFGGDQPTNWKFSYETQAQLSSMTPEDLASFYASIPCKVKPEDIPFEPHCYITSRSVPVEVTKKWLIDHGFSAAPVYSVGFGQSKVQAAKDSGLDIFVDDSYSNFVELNKAGICTYLFDASHNQRYDVGYRRIKSLKDLN